MYWSWGEQADVVLAEVFAKWYSSQKIHFFWTIILEKSVGDE